MNNNLKYLHVSENVIYYTLDVLEIRLFGPPQVILDGRPLKLARRKSRALLYYLAASPEPAPREKLLGLLWAEQSRPAALQTLRVTLYGLRRDLGEYLIIQSNLLSLDETAQVDARLVERGLRDPQLDVESSLAKLELVRGEFLEGFDIPDNAAFEDWLVVEREHFRRIVRDVLTRSSGWFEMHGDYRRALALLERALQADSLQEEIQRNVIRLLYLSGDRPGAIRRYDELRRLLDEQLGVPPMIETRALYDSVLTDRLSTQAPTSGQFVSQPARPAISAKPKPPTEFRLPFTGRRKEMNTLQSGLQAGQFVLVEGEPGIGKSRFVEEFFSGYKGLKIITHAHELEQNLPFQPLIEAFRGFFAGQDWKRIRYRVLNNTPKIWLVEIGRLMPELYDQAPGLGSALTAADEARLWEGVRQFLSAIATEQPLALFFDDLHWADRSTLGLIAYLVRQSYPQTVDFLAATRPVSPRSTVMSLVQALTRENKIQRIQLHRLNTAEIRALAAGFGCSDVETLTQKFQNSSEGNPYILSEIVRLARETQRAQEVSDSDLSRVISEPVVPNNVYSLIQSRLARLSEPARRVLDAGVAVGREFNFQVVLLTAGLDESAALDAMDELVESGLIIRQEGFQFTFDHHLTMEVAFHEVGDLRHRLLHRKVAEALERIHQDNLEQVAGLLAWHFMEGNDPALAAPFAFQAGQQAAKLAAWNEAIAFYEQALNGQIGTGRQQILVALAEAFSRSGQLAQASETYRDALQIDPQASDADQRDELKLAWARTLLLQARYSEVIELAQSLLSSGDSVRAMKAELIWGSALSVEGANLSDAKTHLLAALKLLDQLEPADPLDLAQIQFEIGSVTAQQGDIPQAVDFYRASLAAAAQAPLEQSIEQRILAYNNLAYHLLLLGDPAAQDFGLTGLALAEEHGVISLQAYLLSTLGEISLEGGQYEAAEGYFLKGLEIADRLSVKERVAGLTANLGLLALRQGQTNLAIYRLSRALGLADALGTRHLATQIRVWLTPLLPLEEARLRLAEAKSLASESGRQRLIKQIDELEKTLGG